MGKTKNKTWLRGLFLFFVVCLPFIASSAWAEGAKPASGAQLTQLVPGVHLEELVAVVVYGLVGAAMSFMGYMIFEKVAPYPVRKEIEETQNTALGIVIGSVILSIAIVVSSAIHGGGSVGKADGGNPKMLLPGVYLEEFLAVVVFGIVGILLSIIGYVAFEKLAPYPVRKEIEEDQNTSLGILIGAVILSIAMVVSSAIRG